MAKRVLTFAEQREGKFKKSAFEAVRTGRKIADEISAEFFTLVIGDENAEKIAPELGNYGAEKVFVVSDPKLAQYSLTAYAKVIADVMREIDAEYLFMSATAMGKELAPRVAGKIDAGFALDCTDLKVENGEVIATRPVYAGKAFIRVKVNSDKKIYTLRPNVFSAGESDGKMAVVEKLNVNLTDDDFKVVAFETVASTKGKLDVTEADIVVSGGRGLKAPENFKLIEELADVLGAAVGASRAVVDAGWRPHDEQVGQTGKTVSPKLYIAIGISGAIQHLAGMSSSKVIVAINKDKDAPIFQVADYGIAGDLFEVVPALIEELKKVLGK
ncbi:electron transfer flavoprotein subunit alpha/FixB family protein [Candidatus Chrysopegis kryptomonas]|uniref:Electron transfer flavoprotein subunit alpha n=1 Tax=Candidatus Chryseopegocella kryptomonas TaxID=1633643 RepID=A0A0P1N068_9BACT|nr:electron transfer flavoprotein subunit alpha/FixB family protein [Candidatus Chrysopegis kryptomonas]CUT01927.1 electron transfer flavoprotein alpha subunit apoprotein [Candidatus Chrysopegis kryptomonas]